MDIHRLYNSIKGNEEQIVLTKKGFSIPKSKFKLLVLASRFILKGRAGLHSKKIRIKKKLVKETLNKVLREYIESKREE